MTGSLRAVRHLPLHPRFGAVVHGVDLAALDGVMVDLLRTALATYGVLLVRGQDLDEEKFEAFSRAIGNGDLELSARSVSHSRDRPYVSQLTNIHDADGRPIGFGGNTTDYWHSDQEFREQPASLAALYCKVPTPVGGQTSFASTAVANLRMPSSTLQRIRPLWSTRVPASSHDNVSHVEVRHPVLLQSPSDGRLLLYHSENTRRFIGLDEADGGLLKQELLDLILGPHNIYSHSWREGDLLVYDNTQVVHRREAFEGPRWLQGTKIFATPELFAVPAGAPLLTPGAIASKGDSMVQAASSQGIDLRRWDGALGARIEGVDLSADLDAVTMAFIEDAFLHYQVLSFPGQALTPADHVRFAGRFGEIDRYPFAQPLADQPEVVAVTKEPGTALNFGGVWHSDSPYLPIPPKATVLYGVDIPSRGGDTMFADMYAAYDGLTDGMKRMLAGLGGVNSACDVHGDGTEALKLGDVVRVHDPALADSETIHPIVRTHPQTGRKSLYMSRVHLQRFEHMSEAESAPVLDFLARHLSHPVFTARLRWEPGMVVVFDNRCVQHLALNDYPTEYREIHRVVVRDDRAPF